MRNALVFVVATLFMSGCPSDSQDTMIEPTYANVEEIVRTSCVFQTSCHGGAGTGKARLNFGAALAAGQPITDVLVGVTACEYDLMPRVAPGNPDGSWLMIKLAGAHDANGKIQFTPDSSWMPDTSTSSTCPLVTGGQVSFGEVMPQTSISGLPQERIDAIRAWIAAGAHGPDADGG